MTIRKMTIIALFLLSAFALTAPALAQDQGITCEMVRAYVARVGLEQARALAVAHGITASQEQRARACLLQENSSQPAGGGATFLRHLTHCATSSPTNCE